MLQSGKLTDAFRTYWDDMARCRQAKAYWALLHLIVCFPDICAALQSGNAETNGHKYEVWCNENINNPKPSGKERLWMRNKILHQGPVKTSKPGRYTPFAFGQPSRTGQADHMRLEEKTLQLDVGELAEEMKTGVEAWIRILEANPTSSKASNVEKNLICLSALRNLPSQHRHRRLEK